MKWNQCSAAAKLSSALEVIVTFPTALSITVPTPCLKTLLIVLDVCLFWSVRPCVPE